MPEQSYEARVADLERRITAMETCLETLRNDICGAAIIGFRTTIEEVIEQIPRCCAKQVMALDQAGTLGHLRAKIRDFVSNLPICIQKHLKDADCWLHRGSARGLNDYWSTERSIPSAFHTSYEWIASDLGSVFAEFGLISHDDGTRFWEKRGDQFFHVGPLTGEVPLGFSSDVQRLSANYCKSATDWSALKSELAEVKREREIQIAEELWNRD